MVKSSPWSSAKTSFEFLVLGNDLVPHFLALKDYSNKHIRRACFLSCT